MKKELLKDFTIRVSQASRTELIVIMYDVILEDIISAKTAIDENDFCMFDKEVKHAQKFVTELMACLDYRYEISYELLNLYSFAHQELVRAYMKRSIEPLVAVSDMMKRLHDTFQEVARMDDSGAVMTNTQQVYAGLTYGKGCLNESLVDPRGTNRGFMA